MKYLAAALLLCAACLTGQDRSTDGVNIQYGYQNAAACAIISQLPAGQVCEQQVQVFVSVAGKKVNWIQVSIAYKDKDGNPLTQSQVVKVSATWTPAFFFDVDDITLNSVTAVALGPVGRSQIVNVSGSNQ